jgi:hypothetical protein
LTNWFFNLSLDKYIDNTKAQSLNFKSKTHKAQLEDQKAKKSSRRSTRRRKNYKASKWSKKRQTQQNGKEELRKSSKSQKLTKLPLNKLSASSPP